MKPRQRPFMYPHGFPASFDSFDPFFDICNVNVLYIHLYLFDSFDLRIIENKCIEAVFFRLFRPFL